MNTLYSDSVEMKSFTDEEIMQNMQQKYDEAKTCPREGLNRGVGSHGRVSLEWSMYRREAVKRGLI